MSVTTLVFCLIVFASAKLINDVPCFVWSSNLEKIMVPSEIESSKISSFILPSLKKIKPEVVVVYFESQLQTYELASLNTPDSVFAYVQEQVQSHKNSVSIPFVNVDSLLPLDLAGELKHSVIAYHSGASSSFATVPVLERLEDLPSHAILTDRRADVLIVELNHAAASLQQKFARSREIVAVVEAALAGVRHVSIYTGQADAERVQQTLRKRSVESAEESMAGNVTPMVEIKPIAAFNYWTPGWFWEISLIVIIVFGIGAFGIYQLFALPVTYKLAQPKKQKIM